jgi:hypothetical protein
VLRCLGRLIVLVLAASMYSSGLGTQVGVTAGFVSELRCLSFGCRKSASAKHPASGVESLGSVSCNRPACCRRESEYLNNKQQQQGYPSIHPDHTTNRAETHSLAASGRPCVCHFRACTRILHDSSRKNPVEWRSVGLHVLRLGRRRYHSG